MTIDALFTFILYQFENRSTLPRPGRVATTFQGQSVGNLKQLEKENRLLPMTKSHGIANAVDEQNPVKALKRCFIESFKKKSIWFLVM